MKNIVLALILISTSASFGGTPAVASNMAMEQVNRSMMHGAMNNFSRNMSDNYMRAAWLEVYTKDSIFSGFGTLEFIEGSVFRGIAEHSTIKLNGLTFTPSQTDSVYYFDKVGIPHGEHWLFSMEKGKISTWNYSPLGTVMFFSRNGSKREKYSPTEVKKMIGANCLANAFFSKDESFAIRFYNNQADDKFSLPDGLNQVQVANAIFSNYPTKPMVKKFLDAFPDGYISNLLAANLYIADNKKEESTRYLEKIKSMQPELYLTHFTEGRYYLGQGLYKESLVPLELARRYAPANESIVKSIDEKIANAKSNLKLANKKSAK